MDKSRFCDQLAFSRACPYGADSIYAGASIADVVTGGALFKTIDGFISWSQVIPDAGLRTSVNCISISPTAPATSVIFGTALRGVCKSTDGGTTYLVIDGPKTSHPLTDMDVNATAFTPAYRICGTNTTCGTYLRALGDTLFGWSTASGLPGLPFAPEGYLDFAGGSKVLVGFDTKGIYRSLDSGKTFAAATSGLMGTSIRDIKFTPSGRIIVSAGFGDRIFHSDNSGGTWSQDSIGSYSSVFSLTQSTNGTLYAGQYGTGVQKSTNLGLNWTLTDTTVINNFVRIVAADPSMLPPSMPERGVEFTRRLTPVQAGVMPTAEQYHLALQYIRSQSRRLHQDWSWQEATRVSFIGLLTVAAPGPT